MILSRRGKSYNGPAARNRDLARRNKNIVREVTRKKNPLNQEEAAEKYGVSQPSVSLIVRNVNATSVAA